MLQDAAAVAIESSQNYIVTKDHLRAELARLFIKLLIAGISIAVVHLVVLKFFEM